MQNINMLTAWKAHTKPVFIDFEGIAYEAQDRIIKILKSAGYRVVCRPFNFGSK